MLVNGRGNTNSNIYNLGLAAIQGEWIYYSGFRTNHMGKLFKTHIDGIGKEKLSDDSCLYINVVESG